MWRIKFALFNLSLNFKRFVGRIAKHCTVALLVIFMMSVVLSFPSSIYFDRYDPDNALGLRRAQSIAFRNSLTHEDFIYDFDYMLRVLDENFPSFEIIYHRNGVDMRALGRELQYILADESLEMDASGFFYFLRDEYFPHAWPVGHLSIVGADGRYWHMVQYLGPHRFDTHMLEILNNPQSRLFYMPRTREQITSLAASLTPARNLSFDIIEEGRIAYMQVPFLPQRISTEDQMHLGNFYRDDIEGFEHLIIDIRGNGGGWLHY